MGLDMYLKAETYVGGWSHSKEEERKQYSELVQLMGLPADWKLEASPSATISLNVAYWRKANQVHAWFVENVQDGEDNCQDAYVSREKLLQLIEVCRKVKNDHTLAPSLLPPSEGFFFGPTELDEYYFEDIDLTINQLVDVLSNPAFNKSSFYYTSS